MRPLTLAPKATISSAGEQRQQDDAVGEHQPVAAVARAGAARSRRCARIEASTGKPLKAVLAARTRIGRGGAPGARRSRASRRRRRPAPSWPSTVRCTYPAGAPVSDAGSSAMCTCASTASAVMPPNMTIASTPMIASVVAALRLFGLRKVGHAVGDRLDARSAPCNRRRTRAAPASTVSAPPVSSAAAVQAQVGALGAQPAWPVSELGPPRLASSGDHASPRRRRSGPRTPRRDSLHARAGSSSGQHRPGDAERERHGAAPGQTAAPT